MTTIQELIGQHQTAQRIRFANENLPSHAGTKLNSSVSIIYQYDLQYRVVKIIHQVPPTDSVLLLCQGTYRFNIDFDSSNLIYFREIETSNSNGIVNVNINLNCAKSV